ncbi:TrbI/VirB10 family protein [Pelatocladus sp. BLCC-F211]|uniref:TrbI/VirB10 family protein n=1 Tax=Pelatocladus sp. BLCC-F211 TaxID=3342752 RepID=UPI0035B8985B
MTRYSIPSETHPENIDTPINENYQPELGLSDWELQMAKLVGFEEESPTIETQTETEEDAVNLPQPSSPSPAPEASTKQAFSSNPFAKLALVGTTTFALVLVAGAFLSQLMSTSNQKPRKTNIVSPKTPQTTTETRLQQLEGEVETLKTKLALAEQAQAVKLAQQQLRTQKVTPAQPTSQVANSRDNRAKIALQKTPTPTKTVYMPPRVVTRIVTVPQTPPQSTSPLPVVPTPETQPTVQFTPQPTPDPLQEWARLSKLGSYGQVLAVATPNNTNVNRPTSVPVPVQNTQILPQTANSQSQDNTPEPPSSIVSQAQSNSPKSVRVGTSVKAVLATAVFGETSRATNNNKKDNSPQNVFVVRLKEPLKSTNGEVVLPEKTELLTQVSSISEQGLVQLDVVKVVRENNGNLIEQSLPQNAILIRASAGKPLVANQYKKGTSTSMIDAQQFVLGGIGKAAELFNRTESQVTTTSTGTVVTNSNPRRNLLAGILEGGVRTVVPQITQRNQQAISQAMQRTNIWFLPAGKEIEIYINQTMQL